MKPNTITPSDLISQNNELIYKSIIPAMGRQFDSINPVMSEFVRKALEPNSMDDFRLFLDSASEVLPLERLVEKTERNFANKSEPSNRPDNFGIPMPTHSEEKEQSQELDEVYQSTPGNRM